ncbi:MAG: hypothetical protein EBY01_03655 [Actinobacteria bacterium]|nr:hypothetical protein [Actinomycetota bacterium]
MSSIGVLALQGDVREHSLAIQRVGALATQVRRVDDLKSIDAITSSFFTKEQEIELTKAIRSYYTIII